MIMKPKWGEHDVAFAYRHLAELIDSGRPDAVYGVVTKVSASGASRVIEFYLPTIDDQGLSSIVRISNHVAKILHMRLEIGGVRVSGVGMDMIFNVVDSLSRALYGEPGKLKHRTF